MSGPAVRAIGTVIVSGRLAAATRRLGAGSAGGRSGGAVPSLVGEGVERPAAAVRDVTDGMSDRSPNRPTLVR
ncbi:hypothetical protein [Cellulomonas terrae]|uniref:hypothetical protein n=1 Tax=Cellulomonas terrae TaxID=311234 RepID=UPI0011BF24F2|nr:hypothetical protein [Cellulomonas terrae]